MYSNILINAIILLRSQPEGDIQRFYFKGKLKTNFSPSFFNFVTATGCADY